MGIRVPYMTPLNVNNLLLSSMGNMLAVGFESSGNILYIRSKERDALQNLYGRLRSRL